MKKEKTDSPNPTKPSARKKAQVNETEVLSELDQPCWSVISFESRVGKNLSYAEARVLLEKLTGEKVSGLCIITDQAAERLSAK